MVRNIKEVLLNQKSLEKIVETKFDDLDVKVTELTTTVNQLKEELNAVPLPTSNDDNEIPTLCHYLHASFSTSTVNSTIPQDFCQGIC
ncbi:hypothetical protein D1007_07333 [Hordeum vulgare]|nr:hypothetical protein D1007_07333 [Hordeum vulgare]